MSFEWRLYTRFRRWEAIWVRASAWPNWQWLCIMCSTLQKIRSYGMLGIRWTSKNSALSFISATNSRFLYADIFYTGRLTRIRFWREGGRGCIPSGKLQGLQASQRGKRAHMMHLEQATVPQASQLLWVWMRVHRWLILRFDLWTCI